MDITEVRIPKRFYDDHLERDCSTSAVIRETQDHYFVALTQTQFDELMSDASYYSDAVEMMGSDYLGVQSSARATARALRKAVG